MIETPATPFVFKSTAVCLIEMEKGLRDWVMQHVPEAVYSLVRKEDTAVACYGDNYSSLLAQDYDANASGRLRTVLSLTEPCRDSYLDLLRMHVRHIIYPNAPYASEALRLAILAPKPRSPVLDFGFFSLATDDITESRVLQIHEASSIDKAVEQSTAFLLDQGHDEGQAAAAGLVMKEAVTNCVFHAFRQAGSPERKYEPGDFRGLVDGDEVSVCLAKTENAVAIRVTDNAGTMGPLRLGNSLDRHRTDRGLFDSRGRGFYLMRQLSQRLVVIVERGVGTAMEIYFMKEPPQDDPVGGLPAGAEPVRNFELFEL